MNIIFNTFSEGFVMRMCELKEKEVINCRDGERLGFVCNIEFDINTGIIIKLIVPGPCKIWGILGREHEYCIPFCSIKQIGPDVILVDIDINEVLEKILF